MKPTRFALLAALMAAFFVPDAAAQSFCDDRSAVVEQLKNKYQESPTAYGTTNNGRLVEVFMSPSGETWTITITSANRRTCLVSAGQGWTQKLTLQDEGTRL